MKTTFEKALVSFLALCAGALAFSTRAATPVALFEGADVVDGASYDAPGGVTYMLRANGNASVPGGGIQITGAKGISITPSSGNIGNQASTVIIRYTGYDTSALTATDAQALIINHTANASYKDFLGVAATAGGNIWGVWQNTTWENNKTTSGKYGSAATDTKKFALAWDQYSTVQLGSWFWMDGKDKQGWSGLHGNQQIDSIWVGGPNESTTVKPASGMKILAVAVFDSRLTDAEIAAFSFPSEYASTEVGAIWGNMGTSTSDPGSCNGTKSNGSTGELTLNFSKADAMSQKGIKGAGKVKITKIRLVRNGAATAPKTLTLSQSGVSAIVSTNAPDQILRLGQKLYWANKTVKNVAVFEYGFDSPVLFDTDKDVKLTFSSERKANLYTIKPVNSIFKINDYSPAVEVTGDWSSARQIAVNIAQYWNGDTGSTTTSPAAAGQVTTDQETLLGTVAAAAWAQPSADNKPTTSAKGKSFAFGVPKYVQGDAVADNPMATMVSASFSAGANANLKTASAFAGTFRNVFLTAQNGAEGGASIAVSEIPFSSYDLILYMASDAADAMCPVSVNGKYLYPTATEGVNSSLATASSPLWGNGKTSLLTYGANAMRVNGLSGRLAIEQTAKSWGVAALQLVERQTMTYAASVDADTAFDDISWSPKRPAEGFSSGDKLVINVIGTPTITFGSAVAFDVRLTINGGAKVKAADALYEDGCFTGAFASFSRLVAPSVTFADVKAGFTGAYGLTDTGFTLRAQNKEVVSINFASGSSVAGTAYTGLAPVQGDTWDNMTDTWSSRTTKTFAPIRATSNGVEASVCPSMTLEATANNTWQWNDATDVFLKGYLDDGDDDGRASVTVSGVPYEKYDVIVYAATDAAGKMFRSVTVNGASYTYDGASPATAKAGTENWGATHGLVAAYGMNALRIRNQTSATLTVVGGANAAGGRGGIAAIQIVCTGKKLVGTNYYAMATTSKKLSELEWNPTKPLTSGPINTAAVSVGEDVTDPISLDFDKGYTLLCFSVTNAAGQVVTQTKSASEAPGITSYDFSGATGRVEMAFPTGASRVIAGRDTVLPAGGTGKLSFGAQATATVMNGLWGGVIDWNADSALRLAGVSMASVPYQESTAGKVIYALPFADQTAASGVQFAGSLKRDFETGFALKTTRFVTGNGSGAAQDFVQKGGELTVTGSEGPGSDQASTLLAHNGDGAVVTYRLEGGTFTAENAAIQFGWDGECRFAVAGGTLRTKGIASGISGHDAAASFLLESGVVELGGYGIQAKGAKAAYTLGGGTVRAYDDATVSVAHADGLKIAGAVRFEAAAGKTLCIASDNVQPGAAITVGGEGTVVFTHYRGAVTLADTAKVGYVVNINDLGRFEVPAGVARDSVLLYDGGFNKIDAKPDGDDAYVFAWDYTGKNCWWDYGFDGNLESAGTDATVMTPEGVEPYYNPTTGKSLWVGHATPYRDATYPAEFTAVMRGRIVAVSKQLEIGFGSATDGSKYSVALACGTPANEEVQLVISKGTIVQKALSMTVPNAYTGDHLYGLSCATVDDGGAKTQVSVFLDGIRLQVYTFDEKVALGTGFQIGSVRGGLPAGYAKATSVAANNDAFLDFLRVYPVAITDEAMARYAKEYPYVSPNGVASRTFAGDATWTSQGAWNVEPYEGESYKDDKPPAKANVVIDAESPSEVAFDLTETATYETFAVTNGAAISLRKGGTVAPSVKSFMTVGVPLTVDWNAMTLSETPLVVQDGKTMAFDFKSYDVSGVWASRTNVLTGVVTLKDGAQVVGINLMKSAGRTVEFAVNEETHRCELRITVSDEPFVCTVSEGGIATWTWAGQPTTEAVANAQTAFAIWKEGPGTLVKDIVARRYAVKAGLLKANSMAGSNPGPKITVEKDGTFDLNGKGGGYVTVTLAGGALVNGGTTLGNTARQLDAVALTGDSSVGGAGNFGLVANSQGATTLDLGGCLLTKTGDNAFFLNNTTVTGGDAIDIRSGTIEISKTSKFEGGVITNAGTLKINASQAFTVGTVVGGTINNAGTLSAVTLKGEVTLAGTGAYGAITLAEDATVDIAQKHGLTIGGTGTVEADLTQTEVDGGKAIVLFSPVAASDVRVVKVTYAGSDITDRCHVEGGTITSINCEAKIGSKKYVMLSDALAAVSSGGTIVLLMDVALPDVSSPNAILDVSGFTLTVGDVTVKGGLKIVNSQSGGGMVLGGDLTVVIDAWLALAVPYVSGEGRILADRGTLAAAGATALAGDIDVEIYAGGTLDLSAGTSLACRNFKSSGGCIGNAAKLIVTGTLDARADMAVARLGLSDGATLLGAGLAVSDELTLGDWIKVEASEGWSTVAAVPEATDVAKTHILYNGHLGYRLDVDGTALKVVRFTNNWLDYADVEPIEPLGGTYVVTSAFGFASVAARATNAWLSGTVELGKDIDLSELNWTPIVNFSGTFDGKGKSIRGLNNTNVVAELGEAGRYVGGPTNVAGYAAYGLVAFATNAVFRDVTLSGVAISSAADSAAALLGVHMGGDLTITGVAVDGRVEGEGRAVAGLATIGGGAAEIGDVVVTGNVNRASLAAVLSDGVDGANVAQILAGTTWGTTFGAVVATNNAAQGAFDVSVNADSETPVAWGESPYAWLDLPACNLAPAVLHTDGELVFRSFVEANDPMQVPVDPVKHTARMRTGRFPNGELDVQGGWTDQISALPAGATLVIKNDGSPVEFDGWSTVMVDRDITIDLNGNGIYCVYDCDAFYVANGVTLTIKNGEISVAKGFEPYGGDGTVVDEDVTVNWLSESFEERTIKKVSTAKLAAGKIMLVVPRTSSSCLYGIERKSSLADAWQVVSGSEKPGNGGDLELEAPAETASGFYRVNAVLLSTF